MYKYKKMFMTIITVLYLIIFAIELIIYLLCDNNIFGVYYLIMNLVIIFLLVPCAYNYKRYYSTARISKLILIILLGIFTSYLLELIVPSMYGYVDASSIYAKKIFVYKDVIKGLMYLLLTVFTVFEFKVEKVISTKEK